MKIALAMIVRGAPDEADVLDRCLGTIAPFVDGIFITATYRKEKSETEEVLKVAEKYKATTTLFKWVNDFAAARNYNFAQVPKEFEYIIWSDADDVWRGLDKLRPTLEQHPHVEGFGIWYLYDWDEFKKPTVVHKKTMVVKNDGCVEWIGALHEDLEATRALDVRVIQGIERLHLSSKERFARAAVRNLEIAQHQAAESEDPRDTWNLANAQFAIGDYDAALSTFRKFLTESHSEDEKYLAHCRLADTLKSKGSQEEAIKELQIAIGVQPLLPDAYFQLSHLYYTYGNLDKAEEYALQGMVRRPQIHKMIVFNPRDYDYNPMMLLAQIYYQKNRPDLMLPMLEGCLKIYPKDEKLKQLVKDGRAEKGKLANALLAVQQLQKIKGKNALLKAIEKLPYDIRSHPAVAVIRNTRVVKEKSSGKDLVIYCGMTAHQWNPELFEKKGFGGSEEAVIHLARQWAAMGWKVTVYNNCGHYSMVKDGVVYKPFWEWNYRDKQDIVILWRNPKPLEYGINADKVFVDMHDALAKGEFTEDRIKRVTKVFVKTKFHRSLYPNVPDEKIAVVPNGMDFTLFSGDIKKDPYLMINTSSPDRCMDVLPKLFMEVKKRVPKARLQWAYGWEIYKSSYAYDIKKMKWMEDTIKAMDEAGIEVLGRLPQSEIAKLYERASIYAYPTEFAEIDCISVKKAQAAYCIPVATDFGALKESISFGVTVHSRKTKDNWNKPYQFHFGLEDEKLQKAWVDETVALLQRMVLENNKPTFFENPEDVIFWQSKFAWQEVAKRWDKEFKA